MFAIAFARDKNGACPACEFFDALNKLDKAKLMALFQIAADHAKFNNTEKFGDWGTDFTSSSHFKSVCHSPMRAVNAG